MVRDIDIAKKLNIDIRTARQISKNEQMRKRIMNENVCNLSEYLSGVKGIKRRHAIKALVKQNIVSWFSTKDVLALSKQGVKTYIFPDEIDRYSILIEHNPEAILSRSIDRVVDFIAKILEKGGEHEAASMILMMKELVSIEHIASTHNVERGKVYQIIDKAVKKIETKLDIAENNIIKRAVEYKKIEVIERLTYHIKTLSISKRLYNILNAAGFSTLIELSNIYGHEFRKYRGVGKSVYDEAIQLMAKYGLEFKKSEIK